MQAKKDKASSHDNLQIGKTQSRTKINKNRSTSRNKKSLSKTKNSKSKNIIGMKKQAVSNLRQKRNKNLPPKSKNSVTNKTFQNVGRNSCSVLVNKIPEISDTSNIFDALKENTDSRFLEIIDSLRELRKYSFNSRIPSSASNNGA